MSKYPPVYPQAPPPYGSVVGGQGTPQRPFLKNSLEILESQMPVEMENIAVQVADNAIDAIRGRNGDLANSDLAKTISINFGNAIGYGEWNCMVWSAKLSGSDLNYFFRYGDNSSVMFELGQFVITLFTQFHTTVAPQTNNVEVVKTFMPESMKNTTIGVVLDAIRREKSGDESFRAVCFIKDRMGEIFGNGNRWQCLRGPAHPDFDFELDTDGDHFIELRVQGRAYVVFLSERSD
jgi:hypothetical protein